MLEGEGREEWKEGKDSLYELSGQVIGCAMKVHSHLGPGLLESAYEGCLCRALSLQELEFRRQVGVPLSFEGLHLDCGFRLDLLVEESLVVEVKAVSQILPIHVAQLRTYLKITGYSCGLVINFNTRHLREGIRQIYSRLPSRPSHPSLPSA